VHRSTRIADLAAASRLSRELMRHDRWTPDRLVAHQRSRLTELVRHASAHSAFYRARYAGIDLSGQVDLRRLPPVDKATMMANFDDVVTDPRLQLAELERHLNGLRGDELYLGQYRVFATGGSTGRKGVFVADRGEWRQYLAGLLRANSYLGLRPRLPRRRRVATVAAASPQHVTYRMSRGLDIGLHRILRLDATTGIEALVGPLNRHRPEFLYGYPSILSLLAVEQLEGRLRIAPTTLVSSGETHTDDIVATVRAAWDVPWFQLYGTTEVPTLGAHCTRHTGLHLFEDLAIVEVVDENDRPVPAGRRGHRLLVTNLVNRTQPLIRYAISDLVTAPSGPCPCRRPFGVLPAVEGRNDDILYLPGADGAQVAVHPLALRSPLTEVTGLAQYHIRFATSRLLVRAALRAGASADPTRAAIAAGLRARLAGLGVTSVDVDVTVVDRIEGSRDSAGKFKIIESVP
jgi:phenylacetate-coenzyme A ligase PaaK-like adenylate-forming protein